jgi:pimeloyl-ACP methyl ester carboxylesterase
MSERKGRLDRGDGVNLAWIAQDGAPDRPTTVFLPGFNSDMGGNKAAALAGYCAAQGHALLRFDYSGHGASEGRFEDGTIGQWTLDALAVIDGVTTGPLLLVGSSMGGWIALKVAIARASRLAGLIGVAAAPDFTEELMWQAMTGEERALLTARGRIEIPNPYGPPTPVTARLIEDGRRQLVLDKPITIDCPVRLLHGQRDPDVPWELSLRTAAAITGPDVTVTLIKDGDHRLSRPRDITLLERTLASLLDQDRG